MIFYNVDQNSEDWDSLRLGKFTASTFSDLFMDIKTKGYQDAIIKVAYERVTGTSEERFISKYMQRGHDTENLAREAYELLTFSELENGGFYEYNEFVGASPDAKILGQMGGCEFKRPSFRIYNEYLETRKLPKDYFWQIHGQLLCTGWDFIDYMPFSHPNLKQILIRVEKDDKILEQLKEQLEKSIEEVKLLINKIQQ
jgi:hypothetical protein